MQFCTLSAFCIHFNCVNILIFFLNILVSGLFIARMICPWIVSSSDVNEYKLDSHIASDSLMFSSSLCCVLWQAFLWRNRKSWFIQGSSYYELYSMKFTFKHCCGSCHSEHHCLRRFILNALPFRSIDRKIHETNRCGAHQGDLSRRKKTDPFPVSAFYWKSKLKQFDSPLF